MSKKILITGGAGFIGSHLCERLINDGNSVICLDNFFTGSKDNIKHLISNPHFELAEHDIVNEYFAEVDEIYNLACPASPVHYQYDPIKTIKTSIWGITNMLELAKKCNAKILQASTSEVYGDPLVHPQREDYWGNVNPIGIRSCYDEGKRAAETLITDYNRQYNVDTRISNFIIQALKNQDITIYGDGSQTRSFCYVDDLLEGMIALMNKEKFHQPVNIGNDGEFTISELANLVIELTNSNSKIINKPLPQDDPVKRKPDLTRASEILNYRPKIRLKDGLTKTIEYFDKKIKGNS